MVSQINKIVLKSLSTGQKYGLEIIKDIENFTRGKVVLKQPSLYSSLRRMEKKGYITSFWQDSELGGRRHYYTLTDLGKQKVVDNETISEEDIESILREVSREAMQLDEPVVKNNQTFERFDPSVESVSGRSFSHQMRQHTEPEILSEKVQAPKMDTVFVPEPQTKQEPTPFWRESLKNDYKDDDEEEDEEEFKFSDTQKNSRFEINYKDILGDLDADRPSEPKYSSMQNRVEEKPSPTPKEIQQRAKYTKEISEIFSSNNTKSMDQIKKEQELKDAIFRQQNQNTLDEINRRYNLGKTEPTQQTQNFAPNQTIANEPKFMQSQVEITEYTAENESNELVEKEFLNINKLVLTRSIITTFFFVMSVLISYFVFNEYLLIYSPHSFVYWLAIGLAFAYLGIMLFITLRNINKKIAIKKLNWLTNFLYRVLIVVVLLALVISLNLAFGMSSAFQIEYLTLWFVPVIAIVHILISWVVGMIIYSTKKFRE